MPFDYDSTGRRVILSDGHELLVHIHNGQTEVPAWRHTCADLIVGVASSKQIVVLDASGQITWLDDDARVLTTLGLGTSASALAVQKSGAAAVVLATGEVVVLTPPDGVEERRLTVPDASVVAWSFEGLLGVGTTSGDFHVYDGDKRVSTLNLEDPIVAIDVDRDGHWFVATPKKLWRVEPETYRHVTNAPADMPLADIAVTPEGDYIALQLGADFAIVMDYPERETDASLQYVERVVDGVAFGPRDMLGVGLGGGDANLLNLETGVLMRTETHPGRTHQSWMVLKDAGRGSAAQEETVRPIEEPATSQPAVRNEVAAERPSPLWGLWISLVVVGLIIWMMAATWDA